MRYALELSFGHYFYQHQNKRFEGTYLPYNELKKQLKDSFHHMEEDIVKNINPKTNKYVIEAPNPLPCEAVGKKCLTAFEEEMNKVLQIWESKVQEAKNEFLKSFQDPKFLKDLHGLKILIDTASYNLDYFLLNYNAFEHLLIKLEKYVEEFQLLYKDATIMRVILSKKNIQDNLRNIYRRLIVYTCVVAEYSKRAQNYVDGANIPIDTEHATLTNGDEHHESTRRNEISLEELSEELDIFRIKFNQVSRLFRLNFVKEVPHAVLYEDLKEPHKVIDHIQLDKLSDFPNPNVLQGETFCENPISYWLVIIHTIFFQCHTYGHILTQGAYVTFLGFTPAFGGVVLMITPLGGFCSCFIYQEVTKISYKLAFLMSVFLCTISALLYIVTFDTNNVGPLLVGAFLLGIGSSRMTARKFIANEVRPKFLLLYTTIFIGAGISSTVLSPGLTTILRLGAPAGDPTKIGGISYAEFNTIHWFLLFSWSALWPIFFFFFKDPKKPYKNPSKVYRVTNPIDISDYDIINRNKDKSYSFYYPLSLTITCAVIFFCNKWMQESFYTSSPTVLIKLAAFPVWAVGIFCPCNLIYLLPLAITVSLLSKKVNDRVFIIVGTTLFTIGAIITIGYEGLTKWTYGKHIAGFVILFAGSILTESGSQSLLAKSIKPKNQRGYANAGFIGGVCDTSARCFGNLSNFAIGTPGPQYIPVVLYTIYTFVNGCLLALIVVSYKNLIKRYIFIPSKLNPYLLRSHLELVHVKPHHKHKKQKKCINGRYSIELQKRLWIIVIIYLFLKIVFFTLNTMKINQIRIFFQQRKHQEFYYLLFAKQKRCLKRHPPHKKDCNGL